MVARISRESGALLHFVGIGGIGMSGIAEVFLNQGYRVSGSDVSDSESVRRLRTLGAKIAIGHSEGNVRGARVVVVSSAIRRDNPEVVEARKLRIPVIPRAEMLAELMRGKVGIAVAGTHGKTTTTSMIASVLTHAGLDPTLVIGGRVDSLGGNAKLGQGDYVVAEADESDGSFLHLPATFGVVTNVDNDHLDHFGNIQRVEDAFVEFVAKLPFYGVAAVCGEDPGVCRILGRLTKPAVTYGLSERWDLWGSKVEPEGMGTRFEVHWRDATGKRERLGGAVIHVPGVHNVLNALASIAIGRALGLSFASSVEGLASFRGVKRRFEIRWQDNARRMAVVDDYGHHPTEIAATLAAARSVWVEPGGSRLTRRVLVAFQPHRFTRTLHCRDGFMSAFRDADRVWISDIYAAGEEPIDGVSAQGLADDLARTAVAGQDIVYSGSLEETRDRLLQVAKDGDLVLCLGAGSITRLPDQLAVALAARK